ncbi:MAG: transglycosylase SLT domain-containing protein [Christensenellales bacterium]
MSTVLSNLYNVFYASPGSLAGQEKEIKHTEPKAVKVEEVKEVSIYDRYGKQYGISPKLLKAIAKVESGEQPAIVGDDGESIGLFQIQPKWHAQRLREGESLLNPEVNTRIACEILTELMDKYGTLDEVLTAYNCGHGDGSRVYANRVYEELELNE